MNDTQLSKYLAELSTASESVDQYVEQFEDEIIRLLDVSIDLRNPGSVKIYAP